MALGETIGELQQKISWSEYIVWLEYRLKYGPLNPIRMYDQGTALLAAQVNNALGGKATMKDFIFYGKEDTAALVDDAKKQESDLQTFIKSFGGGLKLGKRKRR